MPDVSVVILTMGDRPDGLARAVESARKQRDVAVEVVVVGNGVEVEARVHADVGLGLAQNLGIPEGRNRGAAVASSPLICFLDDDAAFVGDGVLSAVLARFDADAGLAVIGLQVVDEHGSTARRHDPRLRPAPGSPGPATSFPGGACVVRRRDLDAVGGLAGPFFYALEETDLAWRLLDAGGSIWFAADLEVRHPATTPRRHPAHAERAARNRVWLAHRQLPLPLAPIYVFSWLAVTTLRSIRHPTDVLATARGTWIGLRRPLGPRRPMSWRTVARLARLGRPPVI